MMFYLFMFSLLAGMTLHLMYENSLSVRGSRRARGGSRNRALKRKHEVAVQNDSDANSYDYFEIMAPADGIWNKIEVQWESNDVDIDSSHSTSDGYFGLFWTTQPNTEFDSLKPLGDNFNGVAGNAMQVHLGEPYMLPLYCRDTGVDVDQSGEGQTQVVIRAKAGSRMHFNFSIFDLLDEQTTKEVKATIIVYFSMETELSRFQDTVPYTMLVGSITTKTLRWLPPAQGTMYSNYILAFAGAVSAPRRVTISFNTESENAVAEDIWIEISANSKSYDLLMPDDMGRSLFMPNLYVGQKGFFCARADENQNEIPAMVITGYFAPLPTADVRYNYLIDGTYEEAVPFPYHCKSMDVSLAWTTASAGDEILRILHYPAEFEDIIVGTGAQHEDSSVMFSYIVSGTSGQDRQSEFVDRKFSFGDIIEFEADSDLNKARVIVTGKVPDHKYKMRPCIRYVKNEYLLEAGEII